MGYALRANAEYEDQENETPKMRLIAMMACRNEAWIAGLSLRVVLMWNDAAVVLLHDCADASEDIVREVAREVGQERVIILKVSGEWLEMPHRNMMLEAARANGATHLSIVDFDEVLTGNQLRWFKSGSDIGPPGTILQLPGYNLRGGLSKYHNNGVWGNRWFSTAFADTPNLSWTGDQFHHREPFTGGEPLKPYRPVQQGQGGVLHLWAASERRLIAKHALYKVTEHLRSMRHDSVIDREYSWAIKGDQNEASYGTPATWTYADVPESWLAPYSHLMKYLDIDAEPWQEKAVQDLVAEHGRERFSNLDLFGVA